MTRKVKPVMEFPLRVLSYPQCLDAIDRGVKNVIILNGKTLHAILLEIFTAEGAGTLIKETKEENN